MKIFVGNKNKIAFTLLQYLQKSSRCTCFSVGVWAIVGVRVGDVLSQNLKDLHAKSEL